MLWQWSLDNCSDREMKALIRGINVNMRMLNYVFGAYLSELILGHSDNLSKSLLNLSLSAVDGRCTANVYYWKVVEMMRVLICFGKKCWHMPRDWMWMSQPFLDRGPNLDLCWTIDIGKVKKRSKHAPKISTVNSILKTSIQWSTASRIALILRISKCTHCWNRSNWKQQNTTNKKKSWKK